MMHHISRTWGADNMAPRCGCTLLPCGYVSATEANEKDCAQHSWDACKTIRSSHDEEQCPARKESK